MAKKIIVYLKYGSLVFAILFSLLVIWSSLEGGDHSHGEVESPQYGLHFFAYLFLTFFWYVHFLVARKRKCFIYALSIGILIGILLEIIQYFLPYRFFDVTDIIMNFFGAGLILILLPFSKKIDKAIDSLYKKLGL